MNKWRSSAPPLRKKKQNKKKKRKEKELSGISVRPAKKNLDGEYQLAENLKTK